MVRYLLSINININQNSMSFLTDNLNNCTFENSRKELFAYYVSQFGGFPRAILR